MVQQAEEFQIFRKKALEKLQSPEQLNQIMVITSPQGWLVLAAFMALLAAGLLWSFLATVESTVPGQGALVSSPDDPEKLEAIVFVSLQDSRRLQTGMNVRLSPVSVRKEEYGMLVGEIVAIDPGPASQAAMLEALRSDAYAQSLISAGSLIRVQVQLSEDAGTESGYQWTSNDGPPNELRVGTPATADLIIEEQRPISLVFSELEDLFND
jgi:hypothetical protein